MDTYTSNDYVEDKRSVKDNSKFYINIVIPPVNFRTTYRLFLLHLFLKYLRNLGSYSCSSLFLYMLYESGLNTSVVYIIVMCY